MEEKEKRGRRCKQLMDDGKIILIQILRKYRKIEERIKLTWDMV
jgi:hypothetical protein